MTTKGEDLFTRGGAVDSRNLFAARYSNLMTAGTKHDLDILIARLMSNLALIALPLAWMSTIFWSSTYFRALSRSMASGIALCHCILMAYRFARMTTLLSNLASSQAATLRDLFKILENFHLGDYLVVRTLKFKCLPKESIGFKVINHISPELKIRS
jgi:hypothetical protein